MEFYSNTKPQLISLKLRRDLNRPTGNQINSHIINDNITTFIMYIYKEYVEPNFILLVIISFISFILYHRYLETQKQKNEQFNEIEEVEDILDKLDEESKQVSNPGIQNLPTFNPLYSTQSQQQYHTNLDVNSDRQNQYNTHLQEQPNPIGNLYDFNYNYNNVYENPTRNYYSGNVNTYQNAQDSSIPNPHGYVTNYNTSTNDFGSYSTKQNNNTVEDYNDIITKMNNDFMTNLQSGPMNLNTNIPEPTMEPPYAIE